MPLLLLGAMSAWLAHGQGRAIAALSVVSPMLALSVVALLWDLFKPPVRRHFVGDIEELDDGKLLVFRVSSTHDHAGSSMRCDCDSTRRTAIP